MHPLLSHWQRLLWYLFAWLLLASLLAKSLVWVNQTYWLQALSLTCPLALVYAFFTTSAYFICRAFPVTQRSMHKTLAVFLLAACIGSGLLLASAWALNQLINIDLHDSQWLGLAVLGFALYLLNLLAYDVVLSFTQMRQAEVQAAQARMHARDAELQVLRAQINPHFLFNSLNSISALTAIDAAAARDMTIALANFFRLTLALAEQEKIRVETEIELCTQFLAVEKIRFGSKLQDQFDIDDDAKLALLPPMSLQPLLENAIKHGVRTLKQGGCIQVHVLRQDEWLHISVRNPCAHSDSPSLGNQIGLKNLQQRYAALYAEQARVQWQRLADEFVVEITLPLETA